MCTTCQTANPNHPTTHCRHSSSHAEVKEWHFKQGHDSRPWLAQLRDDFGKMCCLCLRHEDDDREGFRLFEVDHWCPKPQLYAVYSNLTYMCRVCNGYKLKRVVPALLNPCNGDLHSRHLVLQDDGHLGGVSDEGKWLVPRLHFDERRGLPPALFLRRVRTLRVMVAIRKIDEELAATFPSEDIRRLLVVKRARLLTEIGQP